LRQQSVDRRASLAAEEAQARYQAERLQGNAIAAGHEDAWGWTGDAGRIRAARRAQFLIEEARLGSGVTCLELGAGTGEFTSRLAPSGCHLVAVELSEVTAEICRQRVGDGVEVVVGNIETGDGISGLEFDAVVGVSVLHHVNLELCFEHTLSRLKEGGRFAFTEPNMSNPQIWLERHVGLVKKWRLVTPHETAFRSNELRQAFERAGLVVERCESFEFLHPATPRRLVPAMLSLEWRLERSRLVAVAGSIRISGRRA
jgi:SAM-dependent methyltransferase